MKSIITEIKRLDQAATKGPWDVRQEYFDRDEEEEDARFEVFPHRDGKVKPTLGEWTGLAKCENYEPGNKANADLIAFYRNNAPKLADAYEKLFAVAERMAGVLKDFRAAEEDYTNNIGTVAFDDPLKDAYRDAGEALAAFNALKSLG